MSEKQYKISDLSPHLFWDVDGMKMDWEGSKSIVIKRVLELGRLNDWIIIRNNYGIKTIAEVAMTFRDLDDVSFFFIATLSNEPIKKFRCYTTKQSIPKHWNF